MIIYRAEVITVQGKPLIENSLSANRYVEMKKVPQSALLEVLVTSYNRPFTVVFTKENGEERTLRGRLISLDGLRGRSKVENLNRDEGGRVRLVDHRTVESLIVDGAGDEVK